MRVVRNVYKFCRTQVYLQRFIELEKQVNRREKEFIEKREQLKKFKELSQLTNKDMMQRFIKNMTGEPFESEAVQKEKERLKSLFDFLEEVKKEGESRNGISKRLAEEERLNRQKIFLTDLARFANKFHQMAYNGKYIQEVKAGLQLSCKNLQSKLEKEGVEFFGTIGEKHNKDIHEKVDGEGEIVKEVLQRGIRTRSSLISKAKVRTKTQ